MAEIDLLRKDAKNAYKAGQLAQSVALYERVLALGAEDPVGQAGDRISFVAVLLSLNRLDDAAVQLEQAVGATPQDARLRHRLGEIQSRRGDHEAAVEQFVQASALEPGNAEHQVRLSAELRTLNRTDEAAVALDRALQIQPDNVHAQILQLEQAALQVADRDGLDAEAPGGAPGRLSLRRGSPRPTTSAARWRQTPIVVAVEAVGIAVLALWLRSLFP